MVAQSWSKRQVCLSNVRYCLTNTLTVTGLWPTTSTTSVTKMLTAANLSAPSWTTHDVQLNYHAPWDGRFTVGVRNAGEKFPPVGRGAVGSRDYDFNLYDGYGRVTYFRYSQTF